MRGLDLWKDQPPGCRPRHTFSPEGRPLIYELHSAAQPAHI